MEEKERPFAVRAEASEHASVASCDHVSVSITLGHSIKNGTFFYENFEL